MNSQSKQSKNKNKSNKKGNNNGSVISMVENIRYTKPKINDSSNFLFRKMEFVADVPSTETFKVNQFSFNPGISESFPWLSIVAPAFEKYKVRKLRLHYKTSQATIVPGMVILSVEFNVSEPLPETKAELLEYAYSTRNPLWQNFHVDISPKDIMNYKDYYTRIGPKSDLKLYDPLFIMVATDGTPSESAISGELWLEYEIEFSLPQRLNVSELALPNFFKVNLHNIPNTGINWLGTSFDNEGSFPILVDQSVGSLTFPEGYSGIVLWTVWTDNGTPVSYEDIQLNLAVFDANVFYNIGPSVQGHRPYTGTAQVTWVLALKVLPGGYIQPTNNGFDDGSNTGTICDAQVAFWNNTYIGDLLPNAPLHRTSKPSERKIITLTSKKLEKVKESVKEVNAIKEKIRKLTLELDGKRDI